MSALETQLHFACALALASFLGCTSVQKPADAPELPKPPVVLEAPPSAPNAAATTEVTARTQTVCDLVCEHAQALPLSSSSPDYTAKETDNVNRVLDAMHADLLACYDKRVKALPTAHGFITVDMVLDAKGQIAKIDTTGGGILGQKTMDCIVNRIKRGKFDPPHGGGTLEVHVPFSLVRAPFGDDTM